AHVGGPAAGAGRVWFHVTVAALHAPGHVRVFAFGEAAPLQTYFLSLHDALPISLVVAAVGADGKVNFSNGSAGTIQLFADVTGWIATGPAGTGGSDEVPPAAPAMNTETKLGAVGPVGAGETVSLQGHGNGAGPAP